MSITYRALQGLQNGDGVDAVAVATSRARSSGIASKGVIWSVSGITVVLAVTVVGVLWSGKQQGSIVPTDVIASKEQAIVEQLTVNTAVVIKPPAPVAKPVVVAKVKASAPVTKPVVVAKVKALAPVAKPVVVAKVKAPSPVAKPVVVAKVKASAPVTKPVVVAKVKALAPVAKPVVVAKVKAPAPVTKPVVVAKVKAPAPVTKPVVVTKVNAPQLVAKPVVVTKVKAPEPVTKPVVVAAVKSVQSTPKNVVQEKATRSVVTSQIQRSVTSGNDDRFQKKNRPVASSKVSSLSRRDIALLRGSFLRDIASGDLEKAGKTLEKLRYALGPDSPFMMRLEAYFQMKTGNHVLALDQYEALLIADANDNDSLLNAAIIEIRLQRYEEAYKRLQILSARPGYGDKARRLSDRIRSITLVSGGRS